MITHSATVVRLVRWLATQGVPTVGLLDIDQPRTIAGCDVTVWRYLPQDRPVTVEAIAGPLTAFHTARQPALSLPAFDPIAGIRRSLAANRVLDADELERATDRCARLASDLSTVRFEMPAALIHGDAQHRNTLWDEHSGAAVLSDWDRTRIGPPDWDLVTIEVLCRRLGHPPAEYLGFCSRYGIEVRDWSGYRVLRYIRELTMIVTNARKSTPGSPQAGEVRRRLRHIDDGPRLAWNIL